MSYQRFARFESFQTVVFDFLHQNHTLERKSVFPLAVRFLIDHCSRIAYEFLHGWQAFLICRVALGRASTASCLVLGEFEIRIYAACPHAPKTLEMAGLICLIKNNDDMHHCSFQCPYLAIISLKQWRPIRMNRFGSHDFPVTSPSIPAVNHLSCSFLQFCFRVLCHLCYACHCLSMLYAI